MERSPAERFDLSAEDSLPFAFTRLPEAIWRLEDVERLVLDVASSLLRICRIVAAAQERATCQSGLRKNRSRWAGKC